MDKTTHVSQEEMERWHRSLCFIQLAVPSFLDLPRQITIDTVDEIPFAPKKPWKSSILQIPTNTCFQRFQRAGKRISSISSLTPLDRSIHPGFSRSSRRPGPRAQRPGTRSPPQRPRLSSGNDALVWVGWVGHLVRLLGKRVVFCFLFGSKGLFGWKTQTILAKSVVLWKQLVSKGKTKKGRAPKQNF